jgi:hypothetical protein
MENHAWSDCISPKMKFSPLVYVRTFYFPLKLGPVVS